MEDLTDYKRRELSEEEFRRLFTKCRPVFVRIADSYIHDAHTAEDIVDESFIRLWEKKDETYTDNWEAYTFRIIINRCLDHLKSRSIRTSVQMELHEFRNRMQMYEITSLQGFNPERIFAAEVKNLFWKCIRSMPEQSRPETYSSPAVSMARLIPRLPQTRASLSVRSHPIYNMHSRCSGEP